MNNDLTFVNYGDGDLAGLFCDVTGFPKGSYCIIEPYISYIRAEKTECVIKEGSRSREIYFILEGLGAGYTITGQGKKRYVYLQDESFLVASIPTIASGGPSRINCEILAGSIFAKINFDKLNEIAQSDRETGRWYISIMLRGILRISERVEQFIISDAKERLLSFLEDNPALAAKVQKQQLASYLGIEPETLSRILGSRIRQK